MRHGRPALPPEQAARVVAAMRRLRDERFGGVNAALGRALGITGAAVGTILSAQPKTKPSLQTAEGVAAMLGMDVHALLAGLPAAEAAAQADPYPERARALARLRGLVSPEIEARLRSVIVHEGEHLTELEWMRLAVIQAAEQEQSARLLTLVTRGRT